MLLRDECDRIASLSHGYGFFNLSPIRGMEPVATAQGADDQVVCFFRDIGVDDSSSLLDLEFMVCARSHHEFSSQAKSLVGEKDRRSGLSEW